MFAAGSFEDPTVFVALIGVFGSLGAIYLASRLSQKTQAQAKEKIEEIHVLVNGQMTEALDRIEKLEQKLGLAAGEEIPTPAIVTITTETPEGGVPGNAEPH
jgi:cell division protein FtsX